MSSPRWAFTTLELLDGRVFVVDQEPCNGMSDLAGPPHPPGPTEILDPATGTWTEAEALNATRSGFVALRLLTGQVLVTGGDNGWYGAYSSTKLFDPATGRWAATGLLNTARLGLVGALLADGRALVAGGAYAEGYRDEADFLSGRVSQERPVRTAELYDPATGRWTATGSLARDIFGGDAYPLADGRVLAIGTAWSSEQGEAQVYEPVHGTWTVAGRLARLPGSASVVLADGSILVIGGSGFTDHRPVATVQRFDPDTGVTREAAPLPAPRSGSAAVRLADGRVLVAGGTEAQRLESGLDAPPTASAFIYDPIRDAWTTAAPMPFAVNPGQALLLANGDVLVTGGSIPRTEVLVDVCEPNAVGWTALFTLGTPATD
ncbi:MAG: Kelch repeat-containing protein [Candidatus Limnocylindrales bacterium]